MLGKFYNLEQGVGEYKNTIFNHVRSVCPGRLPRRPAADAQPRPPLGSVLPLHRRKRQGRSPGGLANNRRSTPMLRRGSSTPETQDFLPGAITGHGRTLVLASASPGMCSATARPRYAADSASTTTRPTPSPPTPRQIRLPLERSSNISGDSANSLSQPVCGQHSIRFPKAPTRPTMSSSSFPMLLMYSRRHAQLRIDQLEPDV